MRDLSPSSDDQAVTGKRLARTLAETGLGDSAVVSTTAVATYAGGFVSEDVVRVGDVTNRIADVHDEETLFHRRRSDYSHIRFVARAADHVLVAEREDVRSRECLLLESARWEAGQERGDRRERNGVDRAVERLAAQTRLRRAPLYCEMHTLGVAIGAIRQRQHVARIDEVGFSTCGLICQIWARTTDP